MQGSTTVRGEHRSLFLLLALIAALGPMTMQIMMPALPAIQQEFQVSVAQAQLAFSVFVFTMGPALLLYGPLSDRYGRRPVLSLAIGIFCLGTLMCLLAPSLGWLVAGRAIQALGSAAGLVITRALLADLFGREGMATALSWMTMAMVIPPMLAPSLGGLLVDHVSWRGIFLVLLLAGVVVLAFTLRYLPDPPPTAAQRDSSWIEKYRTVLGRRGFYPYALQGVLIIGMFYGFMAGAPYLMVNVMGRPATEYGLFFLLPAGGYLLGNYLSARFAGRLGINRMVLIGAALALVFTVPLVVVTGAGWWVPLAFFLPMTLITVANGIAVPSTQSGAISAVPEASGTASSMIGFLQQAVGAIIIQVVGLLQNDTPWPMVGVVLASAVLSAIGALLLQRQPAGRPAPSEAR
ncbi:MAG: Bcr/CflA family efflux MFS transporter [Gammaproteobacteria bacterium]|nr:MAG: Bcr/CflA family efflux MFS transporter [Gammaproteobacteria bacterium]